MRGAGAPIGAALAIALFCAEPVSAATLDVRETFGQEAVTYLAEPGERNEVVMTADTFQGQWRVFVNDDGPLDIGDGCEKIETGALCKTDQRPRVDVKLADGNDTFDGAAMTDSETGKPPTDIIVDAGEGDDDLLMIAAYGCPYGKRGKDEIRLVPYEGGIGGIGYCIVFGGPGRDHVYGTDKDDFLEGESGGDMIRGRGGSDGLGGGADADTLVGGEGRDGLRPGGGADIVRGAADNDSILVSYSPENPSPDGRDDLAGGAGSDLGLYRCGGCKIELDDEFNDGLPGEDDNLVVERVTLQSKVINDEIPTVYGPGHDVLVGGEADEVLRTKRGEDRLRGGGGEDVLDAGNDDDVVDSVDGERDDVDCGPGRDSASIDAIDDVKGCESLSLPRRRRVP